MTRTLSSRLATTGARLRMRSRELCFEPLPGGRTRFSFMVRNEGAEPSAPERATISFAPFGAFVPGRLLRRVRIPAIEPGEVARIEQDFGEDYLRKQAEVLASMTATRVDMRQPGRVPVTMSYAGNFDVFVRPGLAVERHCGLVSRVVAGALNHACFQVGSGYGAYKLELAQLPPDWTASLEQFGAQRLGWGEWAESARGVGFLVKFRPPPAALGGSMELRVTEFETARSTSIEFEVPAPT
jgi:hypothetical protein